MNKKNLDLLKNITFITNSYRKNFDLFEKDDSLITECEGIVSNITTNYSGVVTGVKIFENKNPLLFGEYEFSIINLKLARLLNVDLKKSINNIEGKFIYTELIDLINNDSFNINQYDKLILIHSFILKEEYRKHEIVEEFMEMIYRDYYESNYAIIGLVLPFQKNYTNFNQYSKNSTITVKKENKEVKISAIDFYSLNNFLNKNDDEMNEYKLFALANRCGFKRIENSHLFIYDSKKTLKRIIHKNHCESSF